MHKGEINCDCGQKFYYETIRSYIKCISCGKEYDVKENIIDADEKYSAEEGE